MKNLSTLSRVALCALVLGAGGITTSFAQTPPPAPATASTAVTPEEKAQYQKARDAAFAADPALKKEYDDLHSQMTAAASRDEKQAVRAKITDFETQKLRPAMLKIDANLGPIFAKIDAARAAKRATGGGGGGA